MARAKTITAAAATFGAAFTSLYAAPNLQADITSLVFDPVAVPSPAPDAGSVVNINSGTVNGVGDLLGAFQVFNANTAQSVGALGDLQFFIGAQSQALNGSTFAAGGAFQDFRPTAVGTEFIGFRTNGTPEGNVGWFSINLGGIGGDIAFSSGEFGSNGEEVVIGVTTAVPEPASGALAALALGAVGLRRNRKK